MSNNSNNYIGTELIWTDFTDENQLPVDKPLVFKSPDGSLMFGRVYEIQNGVCLIIDGHFHFDMPMDDTKWSCLEFVFTTD